MKRQRLETGECGVGKESSGVEGYLSCVRGRVPRHGMYGA
jgi:hypothetical protein